MEEFNNDFFQYLGEESFTWFLSWHLWVEITVNESIVEKYYVLIQKKIREKKNILFEDLYTEFSKLKLTRFYSAKSNTLYHENSFQKKILRK